MSIPNIFKYLFVTFDPKWFRNSNDYRSSDNPINSILSFTILAISFARIIILSLDMLVLMNCKESYERSDKFERFTDNHWTSGSSKK